MTISFSEEIDPQAPPLEHKDEQNRAAPSNRSISIPGNQQHDDGKAALHVKAVAGSQPTTDSKHGDTRASGSRQGDTSAMQVGTGSIEAVPPAQGHGVPDEDDDWYKQACRIKEEPASENL